MSCRSGKLRADVLRLASAGLALALLSSCASVPARVMIGAGNQAPFHYLFQQWLLIDESAPLRELVGTVERIALNRGAPFADGDWNIEVRPDESGSGLLVNRAGARNANGLVELEIRNIFPEQGLDLSREFPDGTRIRSYGWWVEDSGHSNKTELHPLIAIVREEPVFTVFVGQDMTGRFAVARNDVRYSFHIPVQAVASVRNLTTGQRTEGNPSAVTMEAKGNFDVRADQIPGQIGITVRLQAADPAARSADIPPFYFARFDRSAGPLIQDDVQVTKARTADDRFFLLVSVDAGLSQAQTAPRLTVVRWEVGGTSQQDIRIRATYRYAPLLGENESSWSIAAIGSTHPPELSLGREAQTIAGNLPSATRVFVESRLIYTVEPSAVSLSSEPIANGYAIHAEVRKVHPLVDFRLRWLVTAGDRTVLVAPGTTADLAGLSARAEEGVGLEIISLSDEPRHATVSVDGETDIGEPLEARTELVFTRSLSISGARRPTGDLPADPRRSSKAPESRGG